MKKITIGFIIAFIFWFILFSPVTAQKINFWAVMFVAGIVLTLYTYFQNRITFLSLFDFKVKFIIVGLFSSIILYLVFYVGKIITYSIFDFSSSQVASVYNTKTGTPIWVISLLLLFIIGPAEEIFWRGYVLEEFNKKLSSKTNALLIASLLYTFVHIWSLNFMLLLAAFVCGVFWGIIYLKYKSLIPVIISHSLWDFAVFVLFPFT